MAPIHPAIVHFPIAFLLTAFALDGLHASHSSLPAAATGFFPPAAELPRLAYLALSAGLLASVPAAATGIGRAAQIGQRGNLYEADGRLRTRIKAMGLHAVLNDVVILASAYVWWCRKANADAAAAAVAGGDDDEIPVGGAGGALCSGGPLAGGQVYAAEPWMVGVEVVVAGLLVLAANLGGALVYKFGLGFSGAGGKKDQ